MTEFSAQPSASFEVPLEMLAACHQRIERQNETLSRLAAHLRGHGSDRQARDASSAVMRYFDTAAAHHHDDEEVDLFPALIDSMAGSDAVCIREIVAGLVADHRQLERRWLALRPQLAEIAAGKPMLLDGDEVGAFVEAYRSHIDREESELLPMAARLLDAAQLQQIGRAMRLRRGISDAAAGLDDGSGEATR